MNIINESTKRRAAVGDGAESEKRLTEPELVRGACFALCFFAFQLTEFTVNDRAGALLGADSVIAVYSVGILCTSLGFLCFPLLQRLSGAKAKRSAVCVCGVLAVVFALLTSVSQSAAPFLTSAFLSLFSLGIIGGGVYYDCALTFRGKRRIGCVLGVGMGCAVLLQFIVQNLLPQAAFTVCVALSVAVIVYFSLRPPCEMGAEEQPADEKTDGKAAPALTTAVALMSLVCALLDGIVVPANAEGQAGVSDFVRLFYAVSLVAAGFVADFKGGKYLSLLTVCLMFLSTVSCAFLTSGAALGVGTSLIYVYSGFYVIFLTVRFLRFAPQSAHPSLWAGMGRAVRGLTVAACTVPTALLYKAFGSVPLIAGSCALSVVIMLILLRDISRVFTSEKEEQTSHTREKSVSLYAEHCGLTPREAEVLEKLLTTEDGVQEIADSLYISRRVLQRYISAIYRKTDTKTRVGLFQSYDGFFSD